MKSPTVLKKQSFLAFTLTAVKIFTFQKSRVPIQYQGYYVIYNLYLKAESYFTFRPGLIVPQWGNPTNMNAYGNIFKQNMRQFDVLYQRYQEIVGLSLEKKLHKGVESMVFFSRISKS